MFRFVQTHSCRRLCTRQNVCACVAALCPFLSPRICSKFFLDVLYYLLSLSFKFQKDPSFCCKIIVTLLKPLFQSILYLMRILSIQIRMVTKWLWNFWSQISLFQENNSPISLFAFWGSSVNLLLLSQWKEHPECC